MNPKFYSMLAGSCAGTKQPVRQRAFSMFKKEHPFVYNLPSILGIPCAVLGAFAGAFVSAMLYNRNQMGECILTCFAGVAVVGAVGGLLGSMIQKKFLKPYLQIAAGQLNTENKASIRET